MPTDGFAFPVRIGRDVNGFFIFCVFFELFDRFEGPANNNVFRREIMLDVHSHPALRQIPDMAHGRHHVEILAQELVDGFSLGGGLHDHQVLGPTCRLARFGTFWTFNGFDALLRFDHKNSLLLVI